MRLQRALLFGLVAASCGESKPGPEPQPDGTSGPIIEDPCESGFADCDGQAVNGCERATDDDPRNCGACDAVCPDVAGAAPLCENGSCEFACLAGRYDCNAASGDGCEIDLRSDPENCGTCGRSCRGAACSDGLCEPIVLSDDGASPIGFGHQPHPLIIDDSYVYVQTYGGDIKRVPKVGGPGTILIPADAQRHAWDLAVDETHLYIHDSVWEEVVRVPKDGSGPAEPVSALVPYLVNVGHLALSDEHVYWTQVLPPPQRIMRAPKSGGEAQVWHATLGLPAAIASHGEHVYWVEPPAIYRASTADAVASPELYAAIPPEHHAGMYFALDDRGAVFNAEPTPPPDYLLGGVVELAGETRLLVQDARVLSLAIDTSHVYYVSGSEVTRVMRVPRGGGLAEPVLVKLDDFAFNPAPALLEFLAVDDEFVFYHEARKGLVLKVAK